MRTTSAKSRTWEFCKTNEPFKKYINKEQGKEKKIKGKGKLNPDLYKLTV